MRQSLTAEPGKLLVIVINNGQLYDREELTLDYPGDHKCGV